MSGVGEGDATIYHGANCSEHSCIVRDEQTASRKAVVSGEQACSSRMCGNAVARFPTKAAGKWWVTDRIPCPPDRRDMLHMAR